MKALSARSILPILICSLVVSTIGQTASTTIELDGVTVSEAGPRNGHSMAYDHESGEVFLFGGADHEKVVADLFVLRSNAWTKIDANGPEPRTFASFAFAGPGYGVLLFGGNRVLFGSDKNPAHMLGDSWLLRDGKWIRLETQTAPEPRAEAAAAYDPKAKRLVLFGGYKLKDGTIERLEDTWEFKNGKWKRLSASGPPRGNGAAMAYDSSREAMVLFGGPTTQTDRGPGTGKTWIFRNDKWVPLNTAAPPNIFNSAMATGFGPNGVVRFGGWTGERRIDETWALREGGWMRIGGRGPSARNHSAMVFDAANERLVLFGGHDGDHIFGDLWTFDSRGWTSISDSFMPERLDNGH